MILVERGLVGLDDPIERHLGSTTLTVYEGESSAVTVRRVLNMTSAVPHGGLNFRSEEDGDRYTLTDLVRGRGIVVFPPGEHYVYSNFAFGLLERLVENVSGKRFADFVTAEVFRPLGMLDSSGDQCHDPGDHGSARRRNHGRAAARLLSSLRGEAPGLREREPAALRAHAPVDWRVGG
jgi:CubicO group peptidase (beta-lactamase class C family)